MSKNRKSGRGKSDKLKGTALENIAIPPSAIIEFVKLYYQFYPNEALRNPERAIRRRLRDARRIEQNYFMYCEWKGMCLREGVLFQIENRVLVAIYALYVLSVHAKDRLVGRFHISEAECDARAAIEIVNGRILSHTEKKMLRVEKEKMVVGFQDRGYLVGGNTVVTVLEI